ncbi:Aggrecan core protein [Labeo rohita]|uniref:Aggrecan core protein n=1 Tax=Labeo rohita TaxID=84645 RepID=A0ABQ8L9M9_LABRO|nr:Aggrecan core protein [Labeo rohita]
MPMSHPFNKSLHLDPLVSRLPLHVTEYSAPKGSSSFSPRHSSGMDTNRILFGLKQGPRTLEQHIIEFLAIANHSDLPDCILIEIFCDGLNELLKARLRREGPRSSLAVFLDFALLCEGSSFTVGVADGERDNAVTAAAHPAHRMAAAPDRDATNTLAAWIAREMAAVSERARARATTTVPVHTMAATAEPAHKMAAKTELRHVTAAIPEPSHAAAVFPEFSQVESVFPESSQVSKASQVKTVFPVSSQVRTVVTMSSRITAVAKMAATPEPVAKMAATPEPVAKMAAVSKQQHKMAAVSKQQHKMAAVSRPLHNMAAIWTPPVVMMVHVLDTPLVTVWAAKMALNATAATPESSPVTAVLHESSHVVPESSHVTADLHKPSDVIAAALPLMAVAMWCVWATHCAPEVPPDHKPAPELSSDHKPAPELSSDHKPAPELSSDHKPAPELSSDHKPAPEAFPVGEAAPMPPEVSAPAVEPLMEGALTSKLSASPFFLFASSVPAFPRSQTMTQPPAPPRRAAAPPAPPRRAAAPSPSILSASSVPALPRSQLCLRLRPGGLHRLRPGGFLHCLLRLRLRPGGLLPCRSCLNHRGLRRDLALRPLLCLTPAPPLPWTVVCLERLEAALWGGAML